MFGTMQCLFSFLSQVFSGVQMGTARQKELREALDSVVNADKHPFEISGLKLQQRGQDDVEGYTKPAHLDIRHLLQVRMILPPLSMMNASKTLTYTKSSLQEQAPQKKASLNAYILRQLNRMAML